MTTMPKRKRILRRLRLAELSLVDRPAVEDALATAIKRGDGNDQFYVKDGEPPPRLVRQETTMQTQQTKRDPAPRSFDSFEAACTYLKSQGATSTEAMREVRKRHPDLLQKYQSSIPARPVEKAKPRAEQDWATAVAEIAARDKVGRAEATRRARRERADLFEAIQKS